MTAVVARSAAGGNLSGAARIRVWDPMDTPRTFHHASWSLLRPLAGALLLLALVAGGVHHHAPGDDSRACGICVLSHASATPVPVIALAGPAPRLERVVASVPGASHAPRSARASSRAPPSA